MRSATLFDADAASYTGTVEVLGVIFRAEDDGYAVLEVQEADGGDGFALVGPVAHLGPGDRAEVSGEWQTHSRYGRQLRAQGALPLDPADREGQVAYLSTLRHIGKKRAERLVDQHGEEVMQVIAADPQRTFQALKGVSVDQAAAATQSWHESRAVRELHVQLAPHGLAHLAAPIHARYAERSLVILHEDPYRLTEVEGSASPAPTKSPSPPTCRRSPTNGRRRRRSTSCARPKTAATASSRWRSWRRARRS